MQVTSPGRPREFDLDRALDTAVTLFWERGYAATSVADLVGAIGITRSSLYQAFGSKDELFAAALSRYAAVELDRLTAPLHHPERGLAAVEAFLDGLVRHLTTPRGRCGCLVTNTTTELGLSKPPIRRQVAALVAALEALFRACLTAARANGELDPGCDVSALARHLTAVAQGLQVLAKTEPGERYLREVAGVTLAGLPRPHGRRAAARIAPGHT